METIFRKKGDFTFIELDELPNQIIKICIIPLRLEVIQSPKQVERIKHLPILEGNVCKYEEKILKEMFLIFFNDLFDYKELRQLFSVMIEAKEEEEIIKEIEAEENIKELEKTCKVATLPQRKTLERTEKEEK